MLRITFLVSLSALVASAPQARADEGLNPTQLANVKAAQALMGVWMTSKDLPKGSPAQEEALKAFADGMSEDVEIGVLAQGVNTDIPFAREFYGKSGAETFARYHWDTVHAVYNAATSGNPVKFEFLGDHVIHAVNAASVVVRKNGCKVNVTIDETWTFTPDHKVRSAKFSYATTALNAAFVARPAACMVLHR